MRTEASRPRLVDTEAAEYWTRRPRGTLYRWASEGRITRYGKRKHWGARWDLNELPRYRHQCSPQCAERGACPPLPAPPAARKSMLDPAGVGE